MRVKHSGLSPWWARSNQHLGNHWYYWIFWLSPLFVSGDFCLLSSSGRPFWPHASPLFDINISMPICHEKVQKSMKTAILYELFCHINTNSPSYPQKTVPLHTFYVRILIRKRTTYNQLCYNLLLLFIQLINNSLSTFVVESFFDVLKPVVLAQIQNI